MAFAVKDWKDDPDHTTPLSAAAIEDMETRLSAYTDTGDGLLVPKSLVDAKGDLFVGTADNTVARRAVGSDGLALVAASGQSDGVNWAAPAPAAHKTSHEPGGADAMAVDAAVGTGSLRTLGTSSTAAAPGNSIQRGTHAARLALSGGSLFNGLLYSESDTGVVYFYTGSAWTIFKRQGAVIKTADETVNNSVTLQNDDHLFWPIEASEKWWFRLFLAVSSPSVNSDFKLGLTAPASTTILWSTPGNFVPVAAGATPNLLSANLSPPFSAGSNNGVWVNSMDGWITAAGTAGTVQLQWAQNTQTVEDTIVKTGSFFELIRLV